MNLRWKIAQSVEIRWWQNYLRKKNKQEYLAWKKQYWGEFLDKCQLKIPDEPTLTCLDVGCGPAGIFTILQNQKTDALDPLILEYEAKLTQFNRKEYPTTNFIIQSFETFLPEKKYDYVFCLNVINHVADLQRCLDKLVAATKRNGLLVVSIDAHNYSFFKYLFRLLPGDILHPHQYDVKEYAQFFLDRNCAILRTVRLKKEFFFDYYVFVIRLAEAD